MVREESEPGFMELVKAHRADIRGIFVGHGHFWVKDKLYREIPVYETSSFGDNPEVIGYLVGVNSKEKRITDTKKQIKKGAGETD
jgi:hypothetical protein